MNGAAGFWKICWGEVWLAGCVQLWFSRAITNTVLIPSAWAFAWSDSVIRANKPSVPKRVTFDIDSSLRVGVALMVANST